jgi:hypothetical protein
MEFRTDTKSPGNRMPGCLWRQRFRPDNLICQAPVRI